MVVVSGDVAEVELEVLLCLQGVIRKEGRRLQLTRIVGA
jgi:hypothetical protein